MTGLGKIVKAVALITAMACIGLGLVAAWGGYEGTVVGMAKLAGMEDKLPKIIGWFPEHRYWLLIASSLIAGVIAGIAARYSKSIAEVLGFGSGYLWRQTCEAMKSAAISPLKYLLVIPVAASVYYALVLPVNYDEAWTYLNFTSKSPLVSLAFYPVPNNHILHSLITHLTQQVPLGGILFRLRISPIWINIGIWVLAFSFVRRFYGEKTALAAVGIGSVLFMSVYYSCMSRGYAYIVLFFLGALYAAYCIIRYGDRLRFWGVFSLCSILGFFTMPSFLYPFLTLNLWLLMEKRDVFRRQLGAGILTALAVAVLYLPAVVVSGVEALVANPFVKPIPRTEVLSQLFPFAWTAIRDILGFSPFPVVLALGVGFAAMLHRRNLFHARLAAVFFAMPLALLLAHSVIPFSRTFVYYGFTMVFLALVPWSHFIEKLKLSLLVPVMLFVQWLMLINFQVQIEDFEVYNTSYHRINQRIAGPYRYYFNSRTFDTNLLFELRAGAIEGVSYRRIYPPQMVNADSLTGYDFIIIDKVFDATGAKIPYLFDNYVNIYKCVVELQ